MAGWIVSLMVASLAAGRSVEIIAHRGESADAPENTMAAFRLAWERKVDAIELDVHLTKDDRLVVCHDPDLKRTAGVPKAIKASNWDELKMLDVGRWKDPKFAGERLPNLDDVLNELPGGVRCYIEIKVGPEAVPALVRSVKKSRHPPEQLVVISFQADTIAKSKELLPELKAYFLADFKRDKSTGQAFPGVEELVATAKRIGADGLDISYQGPIDEEFVRRVRAAGLGLYIWTVDDEEVARRLVKLGVDGITTNKAAWMKELLAR
jgi:glycerophosphoryl diester phosphodiesterase